MVIIYVRNENEHGVLVTNAFSYLAVLHYIKLSKPGLVERITRCVYDVTKTILFRDHEHGIQ